uniref:Uncharacterized protein n=2 Tax=Lutzomyia longipalpis TaxID=7200 RepID=A0A1B0CHD6_LUTLO
MKMFSRTLDKEAMMESRKWFLYQCKRKGLFPNHITSNVNCILNLIIEDSPFRKHAVNLMETVKKKILRLEIRSTHWKLNKLRGEIGRLRGNVSELLGTGEEGVEFFRRQNVRHGNSREKAMRGVKRKFEQLVLDLPLVENHREKPGFIKNLSDVETPLNVDRLLALGPKFVLPTRRVPILHMVADVEDVVQEVGDDERASVLRSKLVNVLQNGITRPKTLTAQERMISSWRNETMQFLRENRENIVVTNADKGNITVIMNKDEYVEKMQELVNDETLLMPFRNDRLAKRMMISRI